MQQCPFCDKVYDESEYSHCPYCSGELEDGDDEVRPCAECGGCLHQDGEAWECSNCDLFEPALYKGFVKFRKVSSLCLDEIL